MKKDIEWLRKEIKSDSFVIEKTPFTYVSMMAVSEAIYEYEKELDAPDEPDLPVIPNYVAGWIESSKKSAYHLPGIIYDGAYNEDIKEWLFKGDKRIRRHNQNKLTRAWLDGYTVEEEKKYYVANGNSFNCISDTMIDHEKTAELNGLTDLEKVVAEKNRRNKDISFDAVNHPSHYKQGKYETIDVIKDVTQAYEGYEGYLVGNIIKYLYRANYKGNKAEDLKKGQFYYNKLIKELEGDND